MFRLAVNFVWWKTIWNEFPTELRNTKRMKSHLNIAHRSGNLVIGDSISRKVRQTDEQLKSLQETLRNMESISVKNSEQEDKYEEEIRVLSEKLKNVRLKKSSRRAVTINPAVIRTDVVSPSGSAR